MVGTDRDKYRIRLAKGVGTGKFIPPVLNAVHKHSILWNRVVIRVIRIRSDHAGTELAEVPVDPKWLVGCHQHRQLHRRVHTSVRMLLRGGIRKVLNPADGIEVVDVCTSIVAIALHGAESVGDGGESGITGGFRLGGLCRPPLDHNGITGGIGMRIAVVKGRTAVNPQRCHTRRRYDQCQIVHTDGLPGIAIETDTLDALLHRTDVYHLRIAEAATKTAASGHVLRHHDGLVCFDGIRSGALKEIKRILLQAGEDDTIPLYDRRRILYQHPVRIRHELAGGTRP